MKWFVLPLLLLLTACASKPPAQKRIDISLRNTGPVPIRLQARAGILSKTIELRPGESWSGWVPNGVPVREIQIEVTMPPVPR